MKYIVVGILAGAIAATAVSGAPEVPARGPHITGAQLAEVYSLVVTFHRATTIQSLDLLMSLWADDATLSFRDEQYAGKRHIQEWFAYEAGPFDPNHYWIALTPLHALRLSVAGDTATVYVEAHYADAATTVIKAQYGFHLTLSRQGERWRITDLKVVSASLLQ